MSTHRLFRQTEIPECRILNDSPVVGRLLYKESSGGQGPHNGNRDRDRSYVTLWSKETDLAGRSRQRRVV